MPPGPQAARKPTAAASFRPPALDKAYREPVPEKLLALLSSPVWGSLLPVDFARLLDDAVDALQACHREAKKNGAPLVGPAAARGPLEATAPYNKFLKMLEQKQLDGHRVFTVDMLRHLDVKHSACSGAPASKGHRVEQLHRLAMRLVHERLKERAAGVVATPSKPGAKAAGLSLQGGSTPPKRSKLQGTVVRIVPPPAAVAAAAALPSPSSPTTLTSPTKKRKDNSYLDDFDSLNADDVPTTPLAKRTSGGGGGTSKGIVITSPAAPPVPASPPPPVLPTSPPPALPTDPVCLLAPTSSLGPTASTSSSSSSSPPPPVLVTAESTHSSSLTSSNFTDSKQEASLASWHALAPPPTCVDPSPCSQEPPHSLQPPPSQVPPLQLPSWPAHSSSEPCAIKEAETSCCCPMEEETMATPYPQPLQELGLTAAEGKLLMAAMALMLRIDSAALEHEPGEYLAPDRVAEVVVGRTGASLLEVEAAVHALGPLAWPTGAWQGNEEAGRLCRAAHEAAVELQRRQQQLLVPIKVEVM